MEKMNETTTESRKKFLVPVVVLLLCIVSLTGAAYAYSSSFNVLDNKVATDEFVLEVYNNGNPDAIISAPISITALELASETEIDATPTVTVKGYTGATATYQGRLTLKDTTVGTGTRDITITKSVLFTEATAASAKDGIINASEVTGAASGSLTIALTIELYETNDGGNLTDVYDGNASFKDDVATLWYKVTVSISGEGIVFNNATPQVDVNNVKARLAEETFKIMLEAEPTPAAP